MGESVHDTLDSTQAHIDAACNRLNEDMKNVARLLMGFRVNMERLKNKIEGALKEKDDLHRYWVAIGSIKRIEGVVHEMEMECNTELNCALGQLAAVEEFAKNVAALETHHLNDPLVRNQVLALTGGKCAYCAVELKDGGGDSDQFCIEHVVPASKGGPNHLSNYVPSCRSCNNSKGDRHVLYFIQNSFVLRQRGTP